MKRITGELVIELEDMRTGVRETVSETNMVTNAVNDILGMNPMGAMYNIGAVNDDYLVWNGSLLPICPNMIGGILLFPGAVSESADNIYLTSPDLPVAYASNDVNATANTKRGSLNLTESMALANGYKFVWEFTPSQGNGTIAAACLTSKYGGANAFGSETGVDTTLLKLQKLDIRSLGVDVFNELLRAVTVDFEHSKLYSIAYAANTVTIKRYRIPLFDIGLNEKLDEPTLTLEDTRVLQCQTFRFTGSGSSYGIFIDGGDGYWYGFANAGNASGNASVYWIKISQSDHTFTEGQWTLSNAALMPAGKFLEGSSYPTAERNAVIRGGWLYVPAYDKTGLYKIRLANSTDVRFIGFGFTSAMRSIGDTGSSEVKLTMIDDLIVGYDFEVDVSDNVIPNYAGIRTECIGTPFFRYKEFAFAWGCTYMYKYRYVYLLTPYLATICNLDHAVVKSADKSMKITYTLTERDAGA